MKRCIALSICLVLTACHKSAEPNASRQAVSPQLKTPDALTLALVPHSGSSRADQQIIRWQEQVRQSRTPESAIEALGWAYVAKARESFDPGFYKLAEQCALALESRQPHSPEALLLRGHVLHNLHQFKAAEPLARDLVARRGLAFDYGLLGDVLMEQGLLQDAIAAYQKMMDLRPDLQSYSRAAHIRWLKGDLEGAIQLMEMAVGAASPRDPDSAAWAYTRLGLYQFQASQLRDALQTAALALEFQNGYPPALLLRGRILLAQGKPGEAAESLKLATERNPLPEYQWTLAEALREAGREDEARPVENVLRRHGASTDPRTFALYLATRGESLEIATILSKKELECRQDVFTHDALAWSLAESGHTEEARQQMELSLAEGTQDARIFLHAAIIAARCQRPLETGTFVGKARALSHMLLPSERERLQTVAAALSTQRPPQSRTNFPLAETDLPRSGN